MCVEPETNPEYLSMEETLLKQKTVGLKKII
jgi:hypothetical protein